MNAIYKFVLGLIGKRSGVVTTLPSQKQIEFQANMLAEKFMQNGIDPNALKSPEQVKNVLANIDQANMRVIPADSAEGKGITEQLLGKKKAPVFDMEGNKIDTSKGIMGGKEINQKTLNEELMKTDNPYSDLVNTPRPRTLAEREADVLAGMEKNNKEMVQRIRERKKPKGDDPEEKADGGRIGLKGGAFLNFIKNMTMNKKSPLQFGKDYLKNVKEKTLRANETGKFMDLPLAEVGIPAASGALVNNQIRKKLKNMNEDQKEENLKMFIMQLENDEFYNKYPDIKDEMIADYTEKLFGEKKADGGRIGYKLGAGKKGVQSLIDLIRNKFGKKSITTADKAPIPPKTLERDMFKTADNRINKKEGVFMEDGKTPDYDYYKEILDDAEDSRGFNVAGDETIEELLRREKEIKDEYDYMYDQYKTGKLDPEPGSKSQARLNLLKKRKEEAELTGDYRLFNRDDADELDELEEFLDQDYKRVKAEQAEEQAVKELAPKMVERLKLKQKYPGITDDLLDKILIDDNPQRKAEVLGSLDETFKMMEKGMSPDEIIDAFKNQSRTKQADGGIMRANFVGGGMGRRGFLKMLAGLGGSIAAAKTGILKLAGKGATKQVAKEVAQQTTTSTPPPYFFKLAEKIKMMGDDATATTDRTIAKTLDAKDGKSTYLLEEDVTSGDTIIKKINKEGDEMITDVEIMELKKGEVVMGKNGKPVKVPDEYEEVTETNSRVYKDEFNDPDYEDGINVDEIIKEVDDKVPSIKYASGGLAYMLGE